MDFSHAKIYVMNFRIIFKKNKYFSSGKKTYLNNIIKYLVKKIKLI